MEFEVLILGSDANAYYMARCCYEEYHKKAYLIAPFGMPYTSYSNILNISYNKNFWEEKEFLKTLKEFKLKHNNLPIILISTNETYTTLIAKNKDILSKDYLFNYPDISIVETLSKKDKFYTTYNNMGLTIPKSIIYDCSNAKNCEIPFSFPLIIKPCNVIEYNHIEFSGKKKIYKIKNKKELKTILENIKKGGYQDEIIIQEFIMGDDSCLFDSVVYVDKNYNVSFITFAQIGLQERSSSMVGNAAVLINGYNQFGKEDEEIAKIKKFMEKIKYQGFAEVDLKYDIVEKKFKVLEINPRQGRCSYYVKALGYNLVKVLVDDLLLNKSIEYQVLKEEVLLSFVPRRVALKYITNFHYKKKLLSMWKKNKIVKPLNCKEDKNMKRKLFLIKRYFKYFKLYKNSYWKE